MIASCESVFVEANELRWPWHTTVLVEWHDYATLADGSPYVNDGAHAVQLRWGKVVVLHAYLDTQIVRDAMRVMAKAGVVEESGAKNRGLTASGGPARS